MFSPSSDSDSDRGFSKMLLGEYIGPGPAGAVTPELARRVALRVAPPPGLLLCGARPRLIRPCSPSAIAFRRFPSPSSSSLLRPSGGRTSSVLPCFPSGRRKGGPVPQGSDGAGVEGSTERQGEPSEELDSNPIGHRRQDVGRVARATLELACARAPARACMPGPFEGLAHRDAETQRLTTTDTQTRKHTNM